ncbi:MAG: membrane protein insertase YidC [Proteobacteria bacterium]|nr:membrane protein insertase YidC [Pseudomonadota bacterium]
MSEQRNIILAVALSIAILLSFHYFYERPRQEEILKKTEVVKQEPLPQAAVPSSQEKLLSRQEALTTSQRVKINTKRLHGSINLEGGTLDDLTLADYHVSPDKKSDEIILLSPENTRDAYFVEFKYELAQLSSPHQLPNAKTKWEIVRQELDDSTQRLILEWKNQTGLTFQRHIFIDDNYLVQVTDHITNQSSQEAQLQPVAQIQRIGTPQTGGYYILHEGLLGVFNGKLQEVEYKKILEKRALEQTTKGGWIGITDKYWLVALIPQQDESVQTWFKGIQLNGQDIYLTGYSLPSYTLKPGEKVKISHNAFAGAKELHLLDNYEKQLGFDHFDLAVDFGWFYFLTKPFFLILTFLNQWLGNFGLALIALTILVKIVFFPLANKSYRSMSRMKSLQPKIEALKARFENDKLRMNQELMELYKKEGINPLSGCLPMLIQFPVFFALYKVFFVTIEMRHAPFYGWIHDLSAPDPTNIFNLFGLLSITLPTFLQIGAWPLLMGVTMWLQQKLNPQPADPTQATMFMIMPFMFTFLFASFPAGLVIYWALNNILSIAQQWAIMRLEEKRVSSTINKK